MTGDPDRNAIALEIAREMVAEGQQVILFTHRVEHARELDAALCGAGVQSGVMLGGKAEEVVFERTKRGLKSGALRAGVGTYQAIAQGLDLPSVGCGICVTPIGNNKQQFGQTKGRICRASDGKAQGRLYYLLDSGVYSTKPIRNFVSWGYATRVLDRGNWVAAADYLKVGRR
jgi:superfamily II DNA or RNA helicase